RDPHPRRRGRLEVDLLRRQLPGVRGRQEEAPRRRGRQAEAAALPADALRGAARRMRITPVSRTLRPLYHRTRLSPISPRISRMATFRFSPVRGLALLAAAGAVLTGRTTLQTASSPSTAARPRSARTAP